MTGQDMIGIVAFLLVTLAFLLVGYSRTMFTGLCLGITVVFGIVAWQHSFQPRHGEIVLVMAGLILYWFGLLIVRVILVRSVSLHILISRSHESPTEQIRAEIPSRLVDITNYRLGVLEDDALSLTKLGNAVAAVVTWAYAVFDIE